MERAGAARSLVRNTSSTRNAGAWLAAFGIIVRSSIAIRKNSPIACIVCIEQPRLRTSERLSARGTALIELDGEVSETRVLDVSLGGARLAGAAPAALGTYVTVVLDGMSIRGSVLRIGSDDYVVRFEETAETKVKLIRFVYSGRFSADVPRIVPARVAAATLGRVMR